MPDGYSFPSTADGKTDAVREVGPLKAGVCLFFAVKLSRTGPCLPLRPVCLRGHFSISHQGILDQDNVSWGAEWTAALKPGFMRVGIPLQHWHLGLLSSSSIQRHLSEEVPVEAGVKPTLGTPLSKLYTLTPGCVSWEDRVPERTDTFL